MMKLLFALLAPMETEARTLKTYDAPVVLDDYEMRVRQLKHNPYENSPLADGQLPLRQLKHNPYENSPLADGQLPLRQRRQLMTEEEKAWIPREAWPDVRQLAHIPRSAQPLRQLHSDGDHLPDIGRRMDTVSCLEFYRPCFRQLHSDGDHLPDIGRRQLNVNCTSSGPCPKGRQLEETNERQLAHIPYDAQPLRALQAPLYRRLRFRRPVDQPHRQLSWRDHRSDQAGCTGTDCGNRRLQTTQQHPKRQLKGDYFALGSPLADGALPL
jgi:hypothetical protein